MATMTTPVGYKGTITKAGEGSNIPYSSVSGGGGNSLQILSSLTKGLSSFGDAMQYSGMASAHTQQAGLFDLEAQSTIQAGEYQAKRLEEYGKRHIKSQRSGYAKAGVRLEGSPLEALAASERNLSLDLIMTRLNAANQANQLGFQALQQRIAAGQARTRSVQKIGEGVLNMASSFAMAKGGA